MSNCTRKFSFNRPCGQAGSSVFSFEAAREPRYSPASMNWVVFALMTVVSWGVYGIFLHTGQMNMADPVNGRYKAFLFVGIAYFLTAVLAPLAVLAMNGASWKLPVPGMTWSLIAGIVGAAGA